jgi:hypothetical protein
MSTEDEVFDQNVEQKQPLAKSLVNVSLFFRLLKSSTF